MDQDLRSIKRDALKAKAMYIYEAHIKNQKGGADESDSSDMPMKKNNKKDFGDRKQHKKREPSPFQIEIKCVEVHQNKKGVDGKDDIVYDATICKSPPLRVHLQEEVVGWHKIVRVAIRYANERLRTPEVKEIEVKIGKKKIKIAGDKLAETTINVTEMPRIDQIIVTM